MWVKICGTTSTADAQLAIASGADAIGFVFATSKRQVEAEKVAAIVAALPGNIEKVGVFTHGSAEDIARTCSECGLTAAQLHFTYDAKLVALLSARLNADTKLMQVVGYPVESFDEVAFRRQLEAAINDEKLWGMLLDASTKSAAGGTGVPFDWHHASQILQGEWPQRTSGQGPKLILAGGLRPENVREAIAALRPFGVDAVSGVERSPGHKDPERLYAFVRASRTS